MDNTKNTTEVTAAPTEPTSVIEHSLLCCCPSCKLQRPLLGLKLEKETLFAEVEATMAATLPESSSSSNKSKEQYQPIAEKLKASNFPISSFSVGAWKRVHTKEGELTAKLYFAKRKLVWEFLDGQVKSKIEVAWSDIIGIRALMLPNQPGLLEIELGNPPLFFRELAPLPKKHTTWQQTSDFTGGQAPLFRIHVAWFPPGALDKHYEKLLQSDQNLLELSKRSFPSQMSPLFNTTGTVLPFNIREEQTLLFHHQPQLPHCPTAPPLPPPLYPTPINPTITQELGFVNFSHTVEMASGNIQPTTWENQTIGLPNDVHHHLYYDEPPSMAVEEYALEFPPLCQDFDVTIPSTSYNNLSDHEQVKMVENNTAVDDHQPLMLPPHPPHVQMQECGNGVNQEFVYDRGLGDESLSDILHSSFRVHDSTTGDAQHNHMNP